MRPTDSIVMVLTGPGWGKSAAAFGYVTRAWGRGWRSAVIQFVKGATWNAAERRFADRLGVEWHTLSEGATWGSSRLGPAELGRRAWDLATDRLQHGDYGLVVLDELPTALENGWVDVDEAVAAIRDRASMTSVIVTGRSAPPPILAVADTVTDMQRPVHRGERGILRR